MNPKTLFPAGYRTILIALVNVIALFNHRLCKADTIYATSDYSGGYVTRFNPDGTTTIIASNLASPEGIAADAAGNIWVANYGFVNGGPDSPSIVKITPNGSVSTFATSGLIQPVALVLNKSGSVYVANTGTYDSVNQRYNSYIEQYSTAGIGTQLASLPGVLGQMAIDGSGNLYVNNNNRVYRVTPQGGTSVFIQENSLANLSGLTFDSSGNLYVSDTHDNWIDKFTSQGQFLGHYATNIFANTIAFDSAGNLFCAKFNFSASSIIKITPDGTQSVFASNLLNVGNILIVPEPAACRLLFLAAPCLFLMRRRKPTR